MANITAHELPSGDGEKMRADDPTNDPRPFFRRTLTNKSITNPPFTRKSNPSPHTKRGGNEKYSEEPTWTKPTSDNGEKPIATEQTCDQGARERHNGEPISTKPPSGQSSQGATHNKPFQLRENRADKGDCTNMPPETSTANITAHMLPSGDGEMKFDDPKNDPRAFFRHTRTEQLDYQPTFHTQSQPLPPTRKG